MFPRNISLRETVRLNGGSVFKRVWRELMDKECHRHRVWGSPFFRALKAEETPATQVFALVSTWATNMVAGSYCFPRYVAALAARAEEDAVRYGLLENAWDEAGSYGHTSRSHFWLAVRLAELLGLSRREIERIRPLPAAQVYTDEHYEKCATGDFGMGLGMVCLIEEFTTPEFSMVFNAFLRSCQEGLALSPADFVLLGGAEYFTANISDDERHREEMPLIVASWLANSATDLDDPDAVMSDLLPIREGVRLSVELRQKFFDGIHAFVQKGGTYRDLVG